MRKGIKRVFAHVGLVAFLSLSLFYCSGARAAFGDPAETKRSPEWSETTVKTTSEILMMFNLGLMFADLVDRDENGNAIFPKTEGGAPIGAAGEHFSSEHKLMGSRLEITGSVTTITKEPFPDENSAEYTLTMEICPDAQGNVPLQLSFKKRVGLVGKGEQLGVESKVTGHVNNEGTLDSHDERSTFTGARQSIKGVGENSGTTNNYFELQLDMTISRNPGIPSTETKSYIRQSSETDETFNQKAINDMNFMKNTMIAGALIKAEKLWRNGYCVEVQVPELGAGTKTVQPNSETPFTGKVRHKWEGTDLTVPVIATLADGQVSVHPSGSKVPAPAVFTYTAPDEFNLGAATVNLETRSNRGIAERDVKFTSKMDSWSGTASLTAAEGRFSAKVTWVYDPLLSNRSGHAIYHPEGTATLEFFEPCISSSPSSYPITQANGFLSIDYNTSPPTYHAEGVTTWTATAIDKCGSPSVPGVPAGGPWLLTWGEDLIPTPLVGASITGTLTKGDITWTWNFTRD